MKLIAKIPLNEELSERILNAALEIKKIIPSESFVLILKDLIEGIKEYFQSEESN